MEKEKDKITDLYDLENINTGEVVGADFLASVIRTWMKGCRRGLVGMDGMCGSGKTTLANRLGQILEIPVVHMDDYYLPFSQREADWKNICAGNMDLCRLEREVLLPLSRGQAVRTFRYNCRQDKMVKDNREAASFAIVEGTYSLHPRVRSYFDLTFFLSVADRLQKSRLEAREGTNYQNFLDLWIPMEKHYFQELDPKKNADFRIELDAEGRVIRCEETGKRGIIT
jgi:uridine kinase